MQVMLNEQDSNNLKQHIKTILNSAVEEVERRAAINCPFLKGKRAAAKYLNISVQTLDKMILQGLPVHYIDEDSSICFISKKEISEFIQNH